MPKPRKTTEVVKIKGMVNEHLAKKDASSTPESRWAMISLLERVLFDTGNYKGFQYGLGCFDFSKPLPDGSGFKKLPTYDETRRRYY